MTEKRIVLVALDGSKNADNALNWFLEKCRREGDEVVGYCAWQHPHLPTFSLKAPFQLPTEEWQKIMEETRAQVQKNDDSFSTTCQSLKIQYKFFAEDCSKPGEGIVAYAKKINADLIIMGTRGLSTLRRTVLGSVSDYVLHHSGIPVAVVPTPEESSSE